MKLQTKKRVQIIETIMSNIFSRIGIGCANWNREYNGSVLSEKEIERILGYCQSAGIDTLDMAIAYGNDFSRPNSFFKKVIKVQSVSEVEKVMEYNPYCVMAHKPEIAHDIRREFSKYCSPQHLFGVSVYDSKDYVNTACDVVQFPYSLYDRRFESDLYDRKTYSDNANLIEIHVRSVFLRGKIVQDGIPAEECIKFVLANPYVDKIILGIDSAEQLQKNLDFIWKWQELEKHDEKLLDPRKWKAE